MDNRTLLCRDIIEILDHADRGLSVDEIQKRLGYSNAVTILAACKEITSVSEKINMSNHYHLEIDNSKRGIFELKRYSTNLQTLYQQIFSNDISYDILMTLIQRRSISSENICRTHSISRSTLQRKIKSINKEIESFQVYITCSEKIQFKSDELLIRSFSFFFFWTMHRDLNNNYFLSDSAQYVHTADRILNYLGCAHDPIKSRSLALWIKFFSIGISKKEKLTFSAEKIHLIEKFQIPECPEFLPAWDDLEWRTLLGVIFVSNIYSYELSFRYTDLESFLAPGDLTCGDFVRISEKYFSTLSKNAKKKVQQEIARYQLLNIFINPRAKKRLRIITDHVLSFKFLKKNYPVYWERYAYFWIDLKKELRLDEQHSYMRYLCLNICLDVFPLEKYLPQINIHLSSDVDRAYENYLKQAISLHFNGKYKLNFIDNFKEAEFIISTLPFSSHYLKTSQKALIIRAQLSDKDFAALEYLFKKE